MAYPDETWRKQANCQGADVSLFFWEKYSYNKARHNEVLKLCRPCPVKDQCLKFALDSNMGHGIFGGLTPRERTYLQYQQRSAALARQGRDIHDYL